MLGFISHLLAVVGEVGSGGEGSPLSANSSYSEILRLVQLGMFAAILYLIKEFKAKHTDSSETHDEILASIEVVKKLAQDNFTSNRNLIERIKTELASIHQDVNVK